MDRMTLPNYVYVASSWRNPVQPSVCRALADKGIDHYDFRNPPGGEGFSWRMVEPTRTLSVPAVEVGTGKLIDVPVTVAAKGTDHVPVQQYLRMVHHPRATQGFQSDFDAMHRADTFVLLLPCGKSAHLELGWAVGAGKRTAILLEEPVEPELMYRMVDYLAPSLLDLMDWLEGA